MKKIFLFLLCALLLAGNAAAKTDVISKNLSPAIDILEAKNEYRKGNLFGSMIRFSSQDFEEIFSDKTFRSVTVHTLPDAQLGILKYRGEVVLSGEVFQKEQLDELCFLPSRPSPGETELFVQKDDSETIYRCRLVLSDFENEIPKASDMHLKTFQNIPVRSALFGKGNGERISFELVETGKMGVVNLEQDGTFTYSPYTNENGTDRFYYRVLDEYGNRSAVNCVVIQVEKSKNNLYFHDLAGKDGHRSAVLVCSEKIMDYFHDERGLPVFGREKHVTREEFNSYVINTMKLKNADDKGEKTTNAVFHSEESDVISYRDALTLLQTQYANCKGKEADVFAPVMEGNGEESRLLDRLECARLLGEFYETL